MRRKARASSAAATRAPSASSRRASTSTPVNWVPEFRTTRGVPLAPNVTMKLAAIALDYDGTIAIDGAFDASARDAIGAARRHGIAVVLVTGRRLSDLQRVAGDLHCFDAVVCENGAVLEFPASGRHVTIGHGGPAAIHRRASPSRHRTCRRRSRHRNGRGSRRRADRRDSRAAAAADPGIQPRAVDGAAAGRRQVHRPAPGAQGASPVHPQHGRHRRRGERSRSARRLRSGSGGLMGERGAARRRGRHHHRQRPAGGGGVPPAHHRAATVVGGANGPSSSACWDASTTANPWLSPSADGRS